MKTTKLSRKQLVMLAIAWNGSLDDELGAHVALPKEKAIVRQLEKKGLVRVTRHETKTDGHRDWYVRTTDEGHEVYCAHNKNAKEVQWQFLQDNDLVRIRWEEDREPFDVSYVDTWTDLTPEERNEMREKHLAIAARASSRAGLRFGDGRRNPRVPSPALRV